MALQWQRIPRSQRRRVREIKRFALNIQLAGHSQLLSERAGACHNEGQTFLCDHDHRSRGIKFLAENTSSIYDQGNDYVTSDAIREGSIRRLSVAVAIVPQILWLGGLLCAALRSYRRLVSGGD